MIFLNKFPDNSPEMTSTLDFDNDLLRKPKIVFSHRKELATKYIIDTERAIYNNLLTEFYKTLKPFYFNSKQYYLEREKTYNYFTTIIRQICKKNTIPFTSNIKYCNSNYNIRYFIYFD